MSNVAAVAKLTSVPGKRDELAEALRQAVANTHGEPGTLIYILHADTKEHDILWMYELYADQAALDAHMGSEGFKAIGPAIGGLLGAAPELHFVTPLFGKGL
jgi:quinol monooxygenase YgiN